MLILQRKHWCGGSVDEGVLGGLNCMFDDIILAARCTIPDGYKLEVCDWDYLLGGGIGGPQPNALLMLTTPNNQEYTARIRYTLGEGWTLDHISKWHKQRSTITTT